jgi:serine/threonine protein kinase
MLQDVPTMLGGRYRVVERLGRGGMADVYRAEDVVLRRGVAIKIFRGGVEREVHLARFRTEVKTLAALTHPHLVALYDAGGDVAEPWCAMEYVNGGSLADREGTMSPQLAARMGQQIGSALSYVHGRGIVHRDVKPSNVLLDRDGGAFLSDFGIARLVDGTRMTQSGLMIGTAAFLSPEQVRGLPAGPAVDIYALGLVLLEVLTGVREYPGTAVESAVARLARPPRLPEQLGSEWTTLLAEMTAQQPEDRPDSQSVTKRLRELFDGIEPSDGKARVNGTAAPADPAGPTDPTSSTGSTDHVVPRGSDATNDPDPDDGGDSTDPTDPAGSTEPSNATGKADGTDPTGPVSPRPAAAPGSAGTPLPGLVPPQSGPRVWRIPLRRKNLSLAGAGGLLAMSGVVAVLMMGVDVPIYRTGAGATPSSPTTVDPTSATATPSGGAQADEPLEGRVLPVGPLPVPGTGTTRVYVPLQAPHAVVITPPSTQKKPTPSKTPSLSPSPSAARSVTPSATASVSPVTLSPTSSSSSTSSSPTSSSGSSSTSGSVSTSTLGGGSTTSFAPGPGPPAATTSGSNSPL